VKWLCAWIAVTAAASAASPPGFESIFPAGGQVGKRVETQVAGKNLEKPPALAWCSNPKGGGLGGDKPKKYLISIAADASPGPCLIRLYHAGGVTEPRIFEVGRNSEILEKEPNNALCDAQKSQPEMGVAFNGVLGKGGDVDTFPVRARKGKTIRLELHGYALGSSMDPAMQLLDARGVEVAAGHDSHNLDPLIRYTPTADGTLYARVFAFSHPPAANVAYVGGANLVYRLIATEEAAPAPPGAEAKTLTIPATLKGHIAKPHEEDIFTFTAKKGDDLRLNVRAQEIHSPLDATLRITDAAGKVLLDVDDGEKGSPDPAPHWKAPKDGEYRLIVADRFHHGSPDHRYELSVKPFQPTLAATLDTHAYRLEAGKSVELRLTVRREGTFTGKIQARAIKLPAGVSAAPADVPAKGGEVKLTLKAAADAAESQAPFAVELFTAPPDAAQSVLATYAIPFTEPRGDLLITTDAQPWLTVSAQAAKAK